MIGRDSVSIAVSLMHELLTSGGYLNGFSAQTKPVAGDDFQMLKNSTSPVGRENTGQEQPVFVLPKTRLKNLNDLKKTLKFVQNRFKKLFEMF